MQILRLKSLTFITYFIYAQDSENVIVEMYLNYKFFFRRRFFLPSDNQLNAAAVTLYDKWHQDVGPRRVYYLISLKPCHVE